MFKLSEIKELIKLIDGSSVQEIEIENEGARLLIRKPNKTEAVVVASAPVHNAYIPAAVSAVQEIQSSAVPVQDAASRAQTDKTQDSSLHRIVSPMVGTFYYAPSPDAAPFVKKRRPCEREDGRLHCRSHEADE